MYIRSGSDMNYSTLREAYSIDSFEKEKKHKSKKKIKYEVEEFTNDDDNQSDFVQSSDDTKVSSDTHRQTSQVTPVTQATQVTQVTPVPKPMVNVTKPTNIQPYYDEDLEKYLNINEFKSADTPYIPQTYDIPPNASRRLSPALSEIHASQAVPVVPTVPVITDVPVRSKKGDQPQTEKITPKDVFYKNIVNIGLFVLIGVLIIFMCDQITEIAINLGMKKTVAILEPYLNKQNVSNVSVSESSSSV